MKSTIFSVVFIFISLVSFSQTSYFSPNLYTVRILDSLSIPYLPINLRVRNEGFSKKFKSQHLNYFGEDFRYNPYTLSSDLSFKDFIKDKEMVNENDYMYVSILSGLNITVIGNSVIPIYDEKNSSVIILELYCKNSENFDCYTTIALYETKEGKFDYINENFELATSNGWSMVYN